MENREKLVKLDESDEYWLSSEGRVYRLKANGRWCEIGLIDRHGAPSLLMRVNGKVVQRSMRLLMRRYWDE